MNPLDRKWFYRGFRKIMEENFGSERAAGIWKEAGEEYDRILQSDPAVTKHKGAMVLPAVALYRVLRNNGEDAASLLNVYKRFAQVRNSYPALARGEMSAHKTYNYSYVGKDPVAAWYMTSGSEKVLVLHNFSSASVTLSLPNDKLTDAIALNGGAAVSGQSLRLEAWSSVIFLQ